jgi:cytochrome c-type biogenesis protein CcmF
VYYKPLVGWIWGGCVLMALGGVLAVFDRRYRAPRRVAAAAPAPQTGGSAPALARTTGAR